MTTHKKILYEGDKIPVGDLEGSPTFESIATDQINEKTPDAGVTIDGVLLKDGGITPMGGSPCARVYNNANQTITSGSFQPLAFNSERFDTDTIHDTVTNNTRLTCKTAGKYLIVGNMYWNRVAGGRRAIGIRLNGATYISRTELGAVADVVAYPQMNLSTIYDLAANDYVELLVYHSQGGNLLSVVDGNYAPEFMMVRVA